MKTIRVTTAAATLMLSIGLITQEASAQCEPEFLEVCAFDNPSFTGSSNKFVRGFPSTGDVVWGAYFHPSTFPGGLGNDMIGSIIVGPGTRARICRDPAWGGGCFNLTEGGWFDLGSWNNAISSIRLDWTDQSCWNGANWPVFSGEVSVHEHGSQTGDCTTKDQLGFEYSNSGLIGLRNDTMSSIRIGGHTQAVLCRDSNQGGTCQAFLNPSPDPLNMNLSGTRVGNDTVTSMEVGTAPF
jgi:hypothetical protein